MALAATLVLPLPAAAQEPVIPSPTGLVNDFAHVLDSGAIERMTRIAEDVRAKSRGEIAIVTLPDLGGRDVADVALRIGREWKVGKVGTPGDPTRNAGAVILLVPKETSSDNRGRCFVLTGQGTEGFITDATAGDICRTATPDFINRDYSSGLERVTLLTAERFASEFNFSLDTSLVPPAPVRREPGSSGGGIPPIVILIIFFVVLSILSSASRRGGRGGRSGCGDGLPLLLLMGSSGGRRSGGGGWGGGGFGGGGGGFGGFGGGGGFSGGGGGSNW
ncbi:MAG: TPM domain-containing protein [Gemmatimonadaceae bacterium]|nr:TPM domain-containing protein [Gemmatimonadaceae bacterium]